MRRKRARAAKAKVSAKEKPEREDDEDECDEASGEEGDDENEDAEEDDEGNDEDVDVDFEFYDPDESDYHSVGDLLRSGTWDFLPDFNFSDLSDSISGQGNIGTLVKSGQGTAEETVCAMLTALNFRQFQKLSWPAIIRDQLLAKAKKHADGPTATKLEALLQRKSGTEELGLLINERFVNLPPQLVPPLHKALIEDIEWSCTTPECPADERPFYRFSHLLGVVRCFGATGGSSGAAGSAAPAPKGKKRRRLAAPGTVGEATSTGGLVYPQAEDEAYVRKASLFFTFPVGGGKREGSTCVNSSGLPELRGVFLITRKALDEAIAEVPAVLATAD